MIANLKRLNFIKRFYGIEISRLREIYQRKGHEIANINPLELPNIKRELIDHNAIDPVKVPFMIGNKSVTNTRDLRRVLDDIYCSTVGYEISHVPDKELSWLTEKIESIMTTQFIKETKKDIAKLLLKTEAFDLFMQKRFSQVKRYSLEGCESMAVIFDLILKTAIGVENVMVTMPHRGRLNLMTVLMNYPAEAIFHKLAGNSELPEGIKGSADVLSHLSCQNRVTIAGNEEGQVTLLPNSSHLEAGNSVGLGAAYAYQKYGNQKCLSVQFHGDAAFTGQGVVSECLQLSQLESFCVDGTIHIICNNQLGFTTPAECGRSSKYASDPAKAIDAPIFHVNADCPENVARVTCLAVEYQKEFKKDVVIDLIGWRKMGHNELDEPSFTQPSMYEKIRKKLSTAKRYAKDVFDAETTEEIEKEAHEELEIASRRASDHKPVLIGIQKNWNENFNKDNVTLSKDLLIKVGLQSVKCPNGFKIHPRLQKYHVDHRIDLIKQGRVDWATAEAMALGSLAFEGYKVRLSGQDVPRGTFSQRHLRFHDQETDDIFEPFKGTVELAASNLSEFGVLGFEYGFSLINGNRTVPIWEAQFGDFFNGAQIIFDAFLSSGEAKWALKSNLTILLPHGFDGAGPEHSSCRIERFLQQSTDLDENWTVSYPTTPANYFNLLRSRIEKKKPSIIVGPKILLKSPNAISLIDDLLKPFQPILITNPITKKGQSKIILFVTGKFYYEIEKSCKSRKLTIVRIEQLNPFPIKEIKDFLQLQLQETNDNFEEIIWCQEEPKNMGAFEFVQPKLIEIFGKPIKFVGRRAAASPATGIPKLHKQELESILNELKDMI